MNRIGIIGRTAKGHNLYDGQTVLTRTFAEQLKKNSKSKKILFVDTYNYKHNLIKCFIMTVYTLFSCDYIYILLSKNGLKFYLPFLYYANKIFHKKIYHRVIGGNLPNMILENKNWVKYLNSLNYNYVETKSIKDSLESLDVKNVKVSPNFKLIMPIDNEELCKIITNQIGSKKRFCTFSRVTKEKGITDAINAINTINNKSKEKIFLDIYGPIEKNYENEFHELIRNNKYVIYKGSINHNDSVSTLKKYYMLLFPTHWKGEGFPGTFIDCFASGLPIIASDWNCNSEILTDNKTGYIYNIDDDNSNLVNCIKKSINNEKSINKMRYNCLKEFEKYKAEKVIEEIIKDMKKEV